MLPRNHVYYFSNHTDHDICIYLNEILIQFIRKKTTSYFYQGSRIDTRMLRYRNIKNKRKLRLTDKIDCVYLGVE